jgi:sulfoxide reductase catalytic subunit YedY
MLIEKKLPGGVKSSEITNEVDFHNRRRMIRALGIGGLAAGTGIANTGFAGKALANNEGRDLYKTNADLSGPGWLEAKLGALKPGPHSTSEPATPFEYVTEYNNFYEFGAAKGDPVENSRGFVTDPWQVEVSGEAEITGKFNLEDVLKPHSLEERVYRLRCVEGWSMVVPWVGFPLADLIKRFQPTSKAKYVRFETLYDPEQMPGQKSRFATLDFPYVEGLRMDEALNELAFLAVGVYGKAMPNQNGAPIRLVVPWKYGFKSIKSIVGIRFSQRRPRTTWEIAGPREYGFFANVNPKVDHPRWSQATERRLPGSLFAKNSIETLMFNGYAPQVAHLYKDMNLTKNF